MREDLQRSDEESTSAVRQHSLLVPNAHRAIEQHQQARLRQRSGSAIALHTQPEILID